MHHQSPAFHSIAIWTSKWVWPGNATITDFRPTQGTVKKRQDTDSNYTSKVKQPAGLSSSVRSREERTSKTTQQNMDPTSNPTPNGINKNKQIEYHHRTDSSLCQGRGVILYFVNTAEIVISYADPESFVRGGPILKTFVSFFLLFCVCFSWWGEGGSKYHYKWVIIGPPAKRHLTICSRVTGILILIGSLRCLKEENQWTWFLINVYFK